MTLRPRLAHPDAAFPGGVGSALKPPLCGGASGGVKEEVLRAKGYAYLISLAHHAAPDCGKGMAVFEPRGEVTSVESNFPFLRAQAAWLAGKLRLGASDSPRG